METEVKLSFNNKESLFDAVSKDSFRKYLNGNSYYAATLENRYLDTDEMLLNKRSGALRIRHIIDNKLNSFEFTVKYGGGSADGLHKRYEWNMRSDNDDFKIEDFRKFAADTEDSDPVEMLDVLFEGIKSDELKILCSNTFDRTKYILETADSKIEACLDSGIIKSSDGLKTDEICELELELISGNPDDLSIISSEIMKDNDCKPLDRTKFKRTLDLAGRG